jgi:hypothetical protein
MVEYYLFIADENVVKFMQPILYLFTKEWIIINVYHDHK